MTDQKRSAAHFASEGRLVLILSLLLLANTFSRQMSGIVGLADLINFGGINQTLVVNAANGALIIFTSILATFIVDRFNRIKLMLWLTIIFTLSFFLIIVLGWLNVPEKVSAALLYLLSQQQTLIFPMVFWVLATDLFEIAQSKRLIPRIGSWTFLGKLAGIGATYVPGWLVAAGVWGQESLTIEMVSYINIFIYASGVLLVLFGFGGIHLRETAENNEGTRETLTEGWHFVNEVPAFKALLLAILMASVVDVIVNFRFLDVSKLAYPDSNDYKKFYSFYSLIAAVVAFILQSGLTSRLIQRFQVKNTFVIQPVLSLVCSAAMMTSAGIAVNFASSLLLKVFRITVDEATAKVFQGLVPEERRGRVSLLMDNIVPAGAFILGSLMTGIIVFLGTSGIIPNYFYAYLAVGVIAGTLSTIAIMNMRKNYEDNMFNWRLKRRKRAVDLLKKLDF